VTPVGIHRSGGNQLEKILRGTFLRRETVSEGSDLHTRAHRAGPFRGLWVAKSERFSQMRGLNRFESVSATARIDTQETPATAATVRGRDRNPKEIPMSAIVSETHGPRQLFFEEVPAHPGRVYLSAYCGDWHMKRQKPTAVFELDKADLVVALRDMFGLIDPLDIAMTLAD
jgi:hypothetical protein